MASEWPEVALEEIADELTVGFVGPMATEYVSEGIPFLRSQNVESLRVKTSDIKYISLAFHERIRKSALQPGDVVIVRTGKPGACAVIPSSLPVANCSDLVIVRCGERLLPEFLAYFVNSAATHHISSHLVGAVQQHFNVGAARRILIPLPTIPEQRNIVHILGTLDDKIELNRKTNETLEVMTRTLFKSWFVDFDPVRAKAEGRDPGLPAHLSDLFPDSFENSPLGDIPKDWCVGVLDDLVAHVLGGDWGKDISSNENDVLVRCIRGADIPDLQKGGTGKMPCRYLKVSSAEKRRLNDGDLVIEISGGSPTQSTGRSVLISDDLLQRVDAPIACSNFCRLLRLKSKSYAKFVYLWLLTLYANDEFLQYENGTTGIKNFAFSLFSSSYKLMVPPPPIVTAFEHLVDPLFSKQKANAAEADTLAALRDTLLPKLISGEIRLVHEGTLTGAAI
ncbi:MAG TPA: restriction endonuclease subunit S [Acidobacteriaceae bacterium]|jgi:type I restriction enzyme S subunit|nr:restriction endonuclease subunit S [Acidobacteriaceae bacterium]